MATAVTRLPGHQPTAEVSDGCILGPAEQLGGMLGPSSPSPGQGVSGEAGGRGMAGVNSGNRFRPEYLRLRAS